MLSRSLYWKLTCPYCHCDPTYVGLNLTLGPSLSPGSHWLIWKKALYFSSWAHSSTPFPSPLCRWLQPCDQILASGMSADMTQSAPALDQKTFLCNYCSFSLTVFWLEITHKVTLEAMCWRWQNLCQPGSLASLHMSKRDTSIILRH